MIERKPAGRPAGAPNKPIPPKQGPRWEAFKRWYATAQLGRPQRTADIWRAFCAGAQAVKGQNES